MGAYLAVKVELAKLAVKVENIQSEVARIDAELLRIRQAVDGRKYVNRN